VTQQELNRITKAGPQEAALNKNIYGKTNS